MTKPQSHRRPPANQRPPLGRVGHCPLRDASPDRETLSWIHFRKHSGGRRGKERREKRKEEKKRTTRRDDIVRCARTSSGEANGLWTLRGHPIPSRLDIHCTLPPRILTLASAVSTSYGGRSIPYRYPLFSIRIFRCPDTVLEHASASHGSRLLRRT